MSNPAQHGGSRSAVLVCGQCGTRNGESESFCSNCGAYLAWDGQRIGPDPREAPPEPELPPVMPGFVQRVKWAVGLDDGGTGAPPAAPSQVPPMQPPPPTPAPAQGPGTPIGAEPLPPVPHARPPAVPPPAVPARDAPPPAAADLPAVRPAERAPKPAARPQQPMGTGPQPGELVCGQCGAGNKAERKYCRLCAAELADAPVARRKRWWQRGGAAPPGTDSGRRASGTRPAAGVRPRAGGNGRFPARWLAWLLVLTVAGGGAYLGRDALWGAFNVVQDRLVANEPVHPSSVTASSFLPGREPGFAADGTVDRSWSPAAAGDGVGEVLKAEFPAPFRLVYVQIRGGAAEQDELFLAEGRPASMRVTITGNGGLASSMDIALADKAGNQQFYIGADNVRDVTLTVQSSKGSGPDKHVAIAEVEFRGRH